MKTVLSSRGHRITAAPRICRECQESKLMATRGPAVCSTCAEEGKQKRNYDKCACGAFKVKANRQCYKCRNIDRIVTSIGKPGARCQSDACLETIPHAHCHGDGTGFCGLILRIGTKECSYCHRDRTKRENKNKEVHIGDGTTDPTEESTKDYQKVS